VGLFKKDFSREEYFEWQSIVMRGDTQSRIFPKQTILNASRMLIDGSTKIILECVGLVNKTKKPEVFFKRYDILIEHLYELCLIERFVPINYFHGVIPHEKYSEIITIRERETNSMIERFWQDTVENAAVLKTQKGQQNKFKLFFETMQKHEHQMTANNFALINEKKKLVNY
jgi:hypothetical protein